MTKMDHKAFIASLPQEELARLNKRNNMRGILQLAGHLGAIAALGAIVWSDFVMWWAAILPLGITLVFLFTLCHEATHKTPFSNNTLNEVAGTLAGVPILLPLNWFRYFHLAHHKYTNDPDRDPELIEGSAPKSGWPLLFQLSGFGYWIGMVKTLVSNALGREMADYVPKRARARIIKEARIYLVIYAAAALSLAWSSAILWLWILPCLVGQPFLRVYLLAEHGDCAFVNDMLRNTRTTFTNPIVRFFAWNMPYHIEHHTLPNVPFHALPALHRHMIGHHGVTADGYSSFAKEYLALVQNDEAR